MPNPILLIDGYKLDHRRQYPEGTTRVYSNWTARGSRVEGQTEVVFLGLQYFLRKYLMEDMQVGFFQRPLSEVLEEYEHRVDEYLGPNTIGTAHIEELHRLQRIPLKFCALPEGTRVPLRVPMLTVENTHENFAWLPNYFETLLSNVLWLPTTSATTAWRLRDLLDRGALATGGDAGFVPWQGHDFSFRGMAGPEAAALSGLGHLVFFTGTDTIPAVELAERYYDPIPTLGAGFTKKQGFIGGSVPATEHSVMCAGGETNEKETFERLLALYPKGIVSVVSDTWNLWSVLCDVLPSLREQILSRDGKLVIRPDSGDPVAILCGDPSAPIHEPARRGVVELLWDTFGGSLTPTGHKLLDPHIGCIYGDAITFERARAILENLYRKGFASTNVVFGVGSYSYQYVTRDTYGFAMKATWAKVNAVGWNLFKAPVTDSGEKFSAKGRLAVAVGPDARLGLINNASPEAERDSLLKCVWNDGEFVRQQTLDDIRAVARR